MFADTRDLFRQGGGLAVQSGIGEPGVVVGLGVQAFKDVAQPVLLGEHTGSPELRARSQGGDPAVLLHPGRTRAEESVEAPVHAQGHGVASAAGLGHGVRVGHVGAHLSARDAHGGQMGYRVRRDRGRQRDRALDPRPVRILLRVGPGGELESQESLRRLGRGSFDGGLLPVARGEQQHARHTRRRFQLEHVDGETGVLALEDGNLAGAGTDDAGRQVLAARDRPAHRIPFLASALLRVFGPLGQRTGHQIGAPLHRPQRTPGLLLGHAYDPLSRVGDRSARLPHPGLTRMPGLGYRFAP
ncbi:hypothetical protein ACFTZF_50160 [Streptomyces mirabilis]|uniref:hypothetical protein n=1 Tax=Streptomyces mirabilis TaxID=68239 RepID=UPI0036251BBF